MGNFTKEYEITRRETQRFYYETWKDMKSFAQKHTQLRSGEFRTKMKEQYVENMARLIRLVQIIRFNPIKSRFLRGDESSCCDTIHSDGYESARNNLHVTRIAQGIALGTKLFLFFKIET